MTPFCLFDSPSIRTGGIGGLPDIALKPPIRMSPRVCLVLPLFVRGQKQGFALPRLNPGVPRGSPLVRFVRRNALHRSAFIPFILLAFGSFGVFLYFSPDLKKMCAYEYKTKNSCCCLCIGCYHFCLFDYDSDSEGQYKQHPGKFAGD